MAADPYRVATVIGLQHAHEGSGPWPLGFTRDRLLFACTGQWETGEDFDDLPGLCDAYEDAASR